MKGNLLKLFIFGLIFILMLTGCTVKPNGAEIVEDKDKEVKLKVFASFYPYYDFALNIGGDFVDITTIVPAGTEPHSFEPSPRMIAELEKADVFIYNGLHMESWVERVLKLLEGKDIYIVEASKAATLININEKHEVDQQDHVEDEHDDHTEDEDAHAHGEYDPHIWVDPINAIKISESIKEAFIHVDAENKTTYENNFSNYKSKLEELDKSFAEGLKEARNRKILVSHSAFAYLTKRYNIEEISVAGISPHAEASPRRLAELTKIARANNMEYIFFEVLASVKTAEILAKEANLEVLTLYNVEGLNEEQRNNGEDYISLQYKNLDILKKALVK